MPSPDITLGPGDTAPITRHQLRQPNKADGSVGDPLNLAGATSVVLRLQIRDRSLAWSDRPASIVGDPANGMVEVDWLATGGKVQPPDVNRRDYDARWIVTYIDGHQISYPNGRLNPSTKPDGFLWLHVSDDFTVVP